MSKHLFTSESVSEGHPDKICDKISDTLLDTFLQKDTKSKVAIEVLATTNTVVLAGEVSSFFHLSEEQADLIVRNIVQQIGYEQSGFDYKTLKVLNFIHSQSPDIALGIEKTNEKDLGAGDQGIMFGYATNEAPSAAFMPAPLFYAHSILHRLSSGRHSGEFPLLEPDGKSQVTFIYDNGKIVGVDNIVVSVQHKEYASLDDVKSLVIPVIEEVIPAAWMCKKESLHINPTGRFVIGGPDGDTGLTGRKIIVDTYGGAAPHGGGAFSGKDATKVDRSAAYMLRYVAKNVVASGLADKCLIQIAYAIGLANPLALYVNTFGTGRISDEQISHYLQETFDFSPYGIISALWLRQPIFAPTSVYGHFGRQPDGQGTFLWEQTDKVDKIRTDLL